MFRYPRHKNQLVFLIRHQINIKLQYKWNILAVFFLRAGSVKNDVDIADFYVKMKVRRTFEPLAPRSTCWHTMEFINWFFWPYQFHSFYAGYPEKPYKGSRLVLFSLADSCPIFCLILFLLNFLSDFSSDFFCAFFCPISCLSDCRMSYVWCPMSDT